MIVRPATQADIPAIVEIVERCGLGGDGIDFSVWQNHVVLVAVRQAQVVGFVACVPAKPCSIVTEFAVLPEHQGGRAAVKLIEGLELVLRHMGMTHWAAWVREKNGVMRGIMDKLGFTRSEEVGYTYHRSLA